MKNAFIVLVIFGLLSSCSPSPEAIQKAVSQTQTAQAPSKEEAISSYKARISEFSEDYVDVWIKVTEKHSNDEYRDLYDEMKTLAQKMADEPAPQGYEKVQEQFKSMYGEMINFVDMKKALLISIDANLVQKSIDSGNKISKYFQTAQSYLK